MLSQLRASVRHHERQTLSLLVNFRIALLTCCARAHPSHSPPGRPPLPYPASPESTPSEASSPLPSPAEVCVLGCFFHFWLDMRVIGLPGALYDIHDGRLGGIGSTYDDKIERRRRQSTKPYNENHQSVIRSAHSRLNLTNLRRPYISAAPAEAPGMSVPVEEKPIEIPATKEEQGILLVRRFHTITNTDLSHFLQPISFRSSTSRSSRPTSPPPSRTPTLSVRSRPSQHPRRPSPQRRLTSPTR